MHLGTNGQLTSNWFLSCLEDRAAVLQALADDAIREAPAPSRPAPAPEALDGWKLGWLFAIGKARKPQKNLSPSSILSQTNGSILGFALADRNDPLTFSDHVGSNEHNLKLIGTGFGSPLGLLW